MALYDLSNLTIYRADSDDLKDLIRRYRRERRVLRFWARAYWIINRILGVLFFGAFIAVSVGPLGLFTDQLGIGLTVALGLVWVNVVLWFFLHTHNGLNDLFESRIEREEYLRDLADSHSEVIRSARRELKKRRKRKTASSSRMHPE